MTVIVEGLRRRGDLAGQGTRFVAVGVVNTAFGYGLFAILEITVGATIPYLYLLLVAHVISVLEAYVLQRRFVFQVQGLWLRDLLRFWSVYLVALAINVVALPLLVEVVELPVLLAQALILMTMTLGTFVAHRSYSFRRPSKPPADAEEGGS